MLLRPATAEDLPAITELQRAYDVTFFGEPEHDADEVRDWLELAEVACVVEAAHASSRRRSSTAPTPRQ